MIYIWEFDITKTRIKVVIGLIICPMEFVSINSRKNLGVREFSVKVHQFPLVGFLFTTVGIFLSSSLIFHRLEADVGCLGIIFPITLITVCIKLHNIVIKGKKLSKKLQPKFYFFIPCPCHLSQNLNVFLLPKNPFSLCHHSAFN